MIYENSLYNKTVTLMFESKRHRYLWEEENKVVKSVTKALSIINKPALVHWASNMAIDYVVERIAPGETYDELELTEIFSEARWAHKSSLNRSAKIGTFLHNWIEDYINGEKPAMPVNEKLQKSVNRFLKWVEKHNVKFLVAEQAVFSKKYVYCGTMDFICVIDGKKYIGDLKTSKGIYPTMMMQVAAYRYAREEEFPKEKYDGQLVLRVGREDGSLETGICKEKEDYQMLFTGFLYSLMLSNIMKKIEKFKPERQL